MDPARQLYRARGPVGLVDTPKRATDNGGHGGHGTEANHIAGDQDGAGPGPHVPGGPDRPRRLRWRAGTAACRFPGPRRRNRNAGTTTSPDTHAVSYHDYYRCARSDGDISTDPHANSNALTNSNAHTVRHCNPCTRINTNHSPNACADSHQHLIAHRHGDANTHVDRHANADAPTDPHTHGYT